MILPVGNNAAFNRSHDCCCQTLSFFVSAYFLRCKLLGLISPSPHCFPHSDSVASTWIWRVGTSGNVILTFFFFPLGLQLLFQTSCLPSELVSNRSVQTTAPSLMSPVPISHSGFTTSAPALPQASSLSIFVSSCLNISDVV